MRELMKREVGLLKMIEGCNVPLSPPANTNPEESGDSIEKLFDDAYQEHAVEKSDDVLEETIAKDASEVVAEKAKKNERERSPATDASVVTIAVTTTVDADVDAGSKAKDVSKDFKNVGDTTFAGGSLDTKTMHHVYIPRWKVTNDSTLDDPYVYRDLTDRLAPPAQFAQLQVMMRAKHNLERKGKLEDKCAEHTTLLSEKDVMIAYLNSLLSLKETESIKLRDLKEENVAVEGEISALSERVTTLEFLLRDKLNSKVASIESKRDCLAAQKSSLESAFKLFNERIEALHDEQTKDLDDDGSYPMGLSLLFLNACNLLSIFRLWDRPLAVRSLKKYVDAMNSLGAIDFSLLSELELKRYSSIVDLIDSLCWEGALAEIHRVEDMHPSSKQLMLPIHRPKYNVVFAKTSLSSSLEIVNLRVQRFKEEAKEKRLSITMS
nr:hypothetical protein [Tanacetum cinerariifolium]